MSVISDASDKVSSLLLTLESDAPSADEFASPVAQEHYWLATNLLEQAMRNLSLAEYHEARERGNARLGR